MINSQNVAQTGSQAYVDQGLRQYMLKVYNYMAGGLCITALISYLIANTSAIKLFFTVAPNGAVGMSGLSWLALLAPFIMIFAFGWVLSRGLCRRYGRSSGSRIHCLYRHQHHPHFLNHRSHVRRHEPLRLHHP